MSCYYVVVSVFLLQNILYTFFCIFFYIHYILPFVCTIHNLNFFLFLLFSDLLR